MAKTWVLDTETKGTGAQVVPLEKVLRKPGAERELELVVLGGPPREDARPEPEPRQPPRFKVVDVMTRRTLAEDADTRTTVELLEGVRSIVDVWVYAWQPATESWRMLTLPEQRQLWAFRGPTEQTAVG